MSFLTNAFYIISVSLMIPVMLALLFGLLYSLYLSGVTICELVGRMQQRKQRREFVEALENKTPSVSPLPDSGELARTLNLAAVSRTDDTLLIGKKIADLESDWKTELQKISDLTKYGPAFGLMGTLIPLGPALVGLANGDLVTMSNNMVVAFATTVVGVLISLIALGIHSAKKRWYREDSILLAFAFERGRELSQPTPQTAT